MDNVRSIEHEFYEIFIYQSIKLILKIVNRSNSRNQTIVWICWACNYEAMKKNGTFWSKTEHLILEVWL